MFARVIVDVPASQVNRPFEYVIPESLASEVQVGMRVVVPFGFRKLQGFIVGLEEDAQYEGEMKEIESLMDVEPVLSPELLELGMYMAEHVFAFLIQCYQTMLPALLKTDAQRYFVLENPQEQEEIFSRLFHYEPRLLVTSDMPSKVLAELIRLKKQGIVEDALEVNDRLTVKTEDWMALSYLPEEYHQLEMTVSKRAYKRRAFLQTLASLGQTEISKKEFLKQSSFTNADLKFAAEQGWITMHQKQVNRDPYAGRVFEKSEDLPLNDDQQRVFEQVTAEWDDKESHVYVLQGITGSGKTEVYLQWIRRAIESGKSALLLVPEISLTPQMVERFKSRFGDRVAVLHSRLSNGERYDEWNKIRTHQADIVVGARSSVFAPLENIGIIILDEEHESTYKQDDSPRYHARDIAIWRGNYHHCPVILGSATPSLESRARAQKGVYTLLRLDKRAQDQPLPKVTLVDMRQEFATNRGDFSQPLIEALQDRLDKGEQSVLLLNRRGYSSFIMCRDCGYVVGCPNCDISLTLHMDTKTMKCHYCGHEEPIPHRCPKCQSRDIRYYGTGTQKVQEELQVLLPTARVLRMDVDTTRKKGQHERILKQFEQGEADILIGTQMIAKGLDFPNVTLVGVVNADTGLHIPDFRANEKSFQLLTQVAGRAGRGEKPGEVLIQTFNPTHYVLQLAQGHQYEAFFVQEMKMRHLASYPPYFYTAMVTLSSSDERTAQKKAYELQHYLREHLGDAVVLLGPSTKSIARLNNRYYFQLILKYKNQQQIQEALQGVLMQSQEERDVLISIDLEPQYFL